MMRCISRNVAYTWETQLRYVFPKGVSNLCNYAKYKQQHTTQNFIIKSQVIKLLNNKEKKPH